jgi:uncharacterized protein YjbJ (UPF0337 family)
MAGQKSGHDFYDAAMSRRGGQSTSELEPYRKYWRYPVTFGRHSVRPTNDGRSAMNWDQIQGNWTKAKGKLRQQWGKLTDDDLTLIDGKREELAGRLQERYGYQKERAEQEIDNWMKMAS